MPAEETNLDRVGKPKSQLVLWIQLNNTHISVNNPENDPKTGRANFRTKCGEEVTLKRIGRAETWLGTKQTMGLYAGGRDTTPGV